MSGEPLSTAVSDEAFNVDRNMNDMLLIYEELQNKYLGGGEIRIARMERPELTVTKIRPTSLKPD